MMNNRSFNARIWTFEKHRILRLFLRLYFILLFVSCVVGFSLSREIGAIMVFSLVLSLIIFICCNCGQCFKTRVIRGHVIMASPSMNIPAQDQVSYIIVSPTAPSPTPSPASAQEPGCPTFPYYTPPPTYEESQQHYK